MALFRKIAIIDLEGRSVDIFAVAADWRFLYLGGKGLASYLFCRYSPRTSQPPSADDICVISAGLLGGTLSAPLGYTMITARSVSTGLMNCGLLNGPFSTALRQAGFDHLVFKGRSTRPAYLYVHDGEIELRNASRIGTGRALVSRNAIRDATAGRETRMLFIGDEGDGQFRLADGSSSFDFEADEGRIGTAMGNKNIIAVACKGTLDIEVKDPEGIIAYEGNLLKKSSGRESRPGDSGAAALGGPAGKVGLNEIEATVAQCLGLPFELEAGMGATGFETVSTRIRLNTGMDLNEGDLKDIAYRSIALERLYNIREGVAARGGRTAAEYRKNGWTRKSVMKKGQVFDRLKIDDLWPILRMGS